MSENTKNTRTNYNNDIIRVLSERYGVSYHFIRMSIRGERHSLTSESILKDYKEMNTAVTNTLNEVINQQKTTKP